MYDYTKFDFDKPVFTIDDIRRVNPQRDEMEQLTAIVHVDREKNGVVGYKDVTEQEFWTQGHMPGYPIMPGVILCECAAQVASFYARKFNILAGDFLGFGGMDDVRFRSPRDPALPADSDGSTHRPTPGTPRRIRVPGVRQGPDGLQRHDDRRSDSRGQIMSGRRPTTDACASSHPSISSPISSRWPTSPGPSTGRRSSATTNRSSSTSAAVAACSCSMRRPRIPQTNYLGIELDYKEGRRAARRLWKRSQPNARVLGGDARVALAKLIPRQSVACRPRLFSRSVVEAEAQTAAALHR